MLDTGADNDGGNHHFGGRDRGSALRGHRRASFGADLRRGAGGLARLCAASGLPGGLRRSSGQAIGAHPARARLNDVKSRRGLVRGIFGGVLTGLGVSGSSPEPRRKRSNTLRALRPASA